MFKTVDYITLAERAKLRDGLTQLSLVCEEGNPDLPLTKIKTIKMDDGTELTVAVVRCTEREQVLLIEDLGAKGLLKVIGEVIGSQFDFYTDEDRLSYEKVMEVGEFRKQEAVVEDGQAIIRETTHPYRFGVFF